VLVLAMPKRGPAELRSLKGRGDLSDLGFFTAAFFLFSEVLVKLERAIRQLQPMLSLGEIADKLRVSRRTVRRALAEAGVRGFVVGAGKGRNVSVRFRSSDVEAWLSRRLEPML